MNRLISFIFITIFSIFSLSLIAGPFDDLKDGLKGKKKDVTEMSGPELPEGFKLPDYSPLGKRIADGEAVYTQNFHWINANGSVSSTNKGWSRVPKDRRNLVYLNKDEAQQEVESAIILATCDLPFSKEGDVLKNGGVSKTIDGITYVFYPSGQLEKKGPEGDGVWEFYTENCKLKEKGSYVESKQHGVWQYFKEDGTKSKSIEFDMGQNLVELKKFCEDEPDLLNLTFIIWASCNKYGKLSDTRLAGNFNEFLDQDYKQCIEKGYGTREGAINSFDYIIDYHQSTMATFPTPDQSNALRMWCD